MQETWVRSLGGEDPLEEEMTTCSSILAWEIPGTEKPGRLQSMGSQRVGRHWVTEKALVRACIHKHTHTHTHNTSRDLIGSLGLTILEDYAMMQKADCPPCEALWRTETCWLTALANSRKWGWGHLEPSHARETAKWHEWSQIKLAPRPNCNIMSRWIIAIQNYWVWKDLLCSNR